MAQTINLELPEDVYHRLEALAALTHRPLAEVLVQTLRGNLPVALADLPAEQRELVQDLLALDDEALWAVARTTLPRTTWRRHRHLLDKAAADALTPGEQGELASLRDATDRFVIRRSVALALLRWRGHTIPTAL